MDLALRTAVICTANMFATEKHNFIPARRRPKNAGFTLIEVSVGVGILGILILSFYTMLASGFNMVRANRENLRASQIMVNRLEGVRLYTWSQLVYSNMVPEAFTEYYYPLGPSNAVGTVYSGKFKISEANIDPPATYATNRMRRVTVTLTWSTGGLQHQRSMSSLVSEYGTQNYIFSN